MNRYFKLNSYELFLYYYGMRKAHVSTLWCLFLEMDNIEDKQALIDDVAEFMRDELDISYRMQLRLDKQSQEFKP